ncbi:hypothetical protein F5Y13DRAFT_123663 [Hypoxylon sp. FL1857]|nr:hypothetical protein F5Y13DRAFT_123663 [Hypoxylon sp. FL1857]
MSPLGDLDPNTQRTNSSSRVEHSAVRGDENSQSKTTDTMKPSASSSRKRKSNAVQEPQNAPHTAPPKKAKKREENKTLDVGDIKLDGEDTEEVPVYDTCDGVREKIRAIRLQPGVSQAAFCRAIAKCLPDERKIQSRQLKAFLEKEGPMSGNTSCVFYSAYVFFEKLRIKEGRPKSEMRLEMEKIHPNGVNTTDVETWFTCFGNERPVHDRYGRVRFV